MIGRDHHAVGLGQGRVQIAHAGHLHALVVETGHMGIVVGDIRPLLLQQVDDVQGRRLADVINNFVTATMGIAGKYLCDVTLVEILLPAACDLS